MPAVSGSAPKISSIRRASVRQSSKVMFGLPTLVTCSTRMAACSVRAGTAATSSSPEKVPARYSVRLVGEAPPPEMVPPVASTQTTGGEAGDVSWASSGAPAVVAARRAARAQAGTVRERRTSDVIGAS